MSNSAKSRAEQRFTASSEKNKRVLTEREHARQKTAAHVTALRSLRMAKEALDREAAEKAAAEKETAKDKKKKRTRLPQAQRSQS